MPDGMGNTTLSQILRLRRWRRRRSGLWRGADGRRTSSLVCRNESSYDAATNCFMRIPALLTLWLALTSLASAADYTRTEDVIYGRKFGTALTLDVIQPKKPSGFAILFMVSGGFFSSHDNINPDMYQAFLERGYTVFAVVHGSQPRF